MGFLQTKLSKDNNGTKNCLVLKQLVAIRNGQNRPIFEPFVNRLLTVPHPLLHLCLLRICLNNSRAFCIHWRITLIAIIHLTPLPLLQNVH
jgi:hypothetical protein